MKRTPFKKKPYTWGKSTTPKEKKGIVAGYKSEKKGLFPKKQSKDSEWSSVREELKLRFADAGILSCELRYEHCTLAFNFGFTWSFAHSLKRRKISTDPEQRSIEIRQVIYTCGNCHNKIENLPVSAEPNMYDIVIDTINKRPQQP